MKKVLLSDRSLQLLFGPLDENIRFLEKLFDVKIQARDSSLTIDGEEANVAALEKILVDFSDLVDKGHSITNGDLQSAFKQIAEDAALSLHDFFPKMQLLTSGKRQVTPKSLNLEKGVSRIILTRPAVEAGERLGFLPGDIEEKINPYLRPLYDALYLLIDGEKIQRFMENGIIEIAPLAFMRGRTLNDAFIILDEAQNTTSEQMKMFLTRIGLHSKAVITGDVTQIDLPLGRNSGLIEAKSILGTVPGLAFCYFNEGDVVRHRLVRLIIKAYQEHAEGEPRAEANGNGKKPKD
jgi:phosphate starvation-inducible PhoH-like protein